MGEDGHDHADHKHAVGGHTLSVGADADGWYLTIALLLIVGFMVFEVVVGIVAHSLALLSDAATCSRTQVRLPCHSLSCDLFSARAAKR